jgi:quinol monooxygenase YgiN
MRMSVNVVAILVAWPGKAEELRALLTGMVSPSRAEPSRAEPGSLQYNLWRDKADLGRFVIEERYLDEAAAAAHPATPHYQHYLATVHALAERTALVLDPIDAV